jgi:bifunctional non-homologous end joining protein LigD
LEPAAPWDDVKPFCRAFAETLSEQQPDRYLSTVKKVDRHGRILIDWLRNGLGATAVASFCPRARPGAGVATPLSWDEVDRNLDPAWFTVQTVPDRLARQRTDPWQGFNASRRRLPNATGAGTEPKPSRTKSPQRKSAIITAKRPKRRA